MSTDRETDSERSREADSRPKPSHAAPVQNPTTDDIERDESAVDTSDEESTTVDTNSESSPDAPPATFRAAIQVELLITVIRSLRAVVDEARIRITSDGISVRAMDPANVAMDDLDLGAAAFESFEATPGTLGVDLIRLADPVTLASTGNLVQLHLDPATSKLVVIVDGLQYTLACLDPATIRSAPSLPDLELPASVSVDREVLQRGVNAADLVSDHIGFRMDAETERLHLDAAGDTDTVALELDGEDFEVITAGEADALFNLAYLKKLARTIPKGTVVALDFGEDVPMALSYELADGAGSVTRMLAPRIRT